MRYIKMIFPSGLSKLLILLILSGSSTALLAQAPATSAVQTPEQYLSSLYYRGDGNLIVRDGEALALKKEASLETRAWFISQALSTYMLKLTSAIAVLDGMRKEAPLDPWTLVARSFATRDVVQSIALCEKATAKDTNENILVLCTNGISNQVRTTADGELLKTYLERNKQKFESSTKVLTAQAEALGIISWRAKDKQAGDDAVVLSERVLISEPHNIKALQIKLNDLTRQKKYKEASDLILSSAPSSQSQAIHSSFYLFVGQQKI